MRTEKYWDKAWSLVEGCTPVSAACDNCWLAHITWRFGKFPGHVIQDHNMQVKFVNGIRIRPDRLNIPLKTKKPTVFAVWSDLFHEDVDYDFAAEAIAIMRACPRHVFLVLTKRPHRIFTETEDEVFGSWPENIFYGTTVENQTTADERIPRLLGVEGNRFLSVEPLLGPVDFTNIGTVIDNGPFQEPEYLHGLADLHWVIVGAESGPKRRPCKVEWVEQVVDQCKQAGVPVFVKQLDINGKLVKDIDKFPAHLRIREVPW